jgi:isopenicillin N synthase-like dioxygenase
MARDARVIATLDEDSSAAAIALACRETGAFQLRLAPERAARVRCALAAAAAFFERPAAEKRALDIERSPHHRGFSEMHNARDWREQLHLGRESPAAPMDGGAPAYQRLLGPNQWPSKDAHLRATLLAHLDDVAAIGRRLLGALDLPPALVDGEAYLIMKLICYHPQPSRETRRPGVAAHVDYSLVTLLSQDERGGLELQLRDGRWHAITPRPGTLVVNLGEIAEAVTGAELRATPHRVINHSSAQPRVSIPVFINPPLAAFVQPRERPARPDDEHVHRVLPSGALTPFVFGDGEWRRKGENIWCAECCDLRA